MSPRKRYVYRPDPETGEVRAFEIGMEPPAEGRLQLILDDIHAEVDGHHFTSKRTRDAYLKANDLTSRGDYSSEWLAKKRAGPSKEQRLRETRETAAEAYRMLSQRR